MFEHFSVEYKNKCPNCDEQLDIKVKEIKICKCKLRIQRFGAILYCEKKHED